MNPATPFTASGVCSLIHALRPPKSASKIIKSQQSFTTQPSIDKGADTSLIARIQYHTTCLSLANPSLRRLVVSLVSLSPRRNRRHNSPRAALGRQWGLRSSKQVWELASWDSLSRYSKCLHYHSHKLSYHRRYGSPARRRLVSRSYPAPTKS